MSSKVIGNKRSWMYEDIITQAQGVGKPVLLASEILNKMKVRREFCIPSSSPSYTQNSTPTKKGYSTLRKKQYYINSIAFDSSAEYCATTAEDHSLSLFDCREGRTLKVHFNKDFGAKLIRFVHTKYSVIHASTKEPNLINYYSFHDNCSIRQFKGHDKKILGLERSVFRDHFMSASADNTVKLWDIRVPEYQASLNCYDRPNIALDQQDKVFAVGIKDKSQVLVYDMTNYHKGPFTTLTLPNVLPGITSSTWSSIKFSPNGNSILITTTGGYHYLINSITGELKYPPLKRTVPRNLLPNNDYALLAYGEETRFTSDGNFVVSGNCDGSVDVWDIGSCEASFSRFGEDAMIHATLTPSSNLRSSNRTPMSVVALNPNYLMMVTGSTHLQFWLPDP